MRPSWKLLVAVAVTVLVAFPAAAGAARNRTNSETALLQQVNRVRVAHGLRALVFDPTLARAARAHTRAMTSSNVFAHGNVGARLREFHVTGPSVGENLAWGTGQMGTAEGIVEAWLASPGHRRNLLDPGFRRIGLGELQTRFLGADGANVVTADFAGV
jgi:uncharacterized protein YkwD